MTYKAMTSFAWRSSWRLLLMTWLVLGGFDAAKGEPAGTAAVVVIVAGAMLYVLGADLFRIGRRAYREHKAEQEPAS